MPVVLFRFRLTIIQSLYQHSATLYVLNLFPLPSFACMNDQFSRSLNILSRSSISLSKRFWCMFNAYNCILFLLDLCPLPMCVPLPSKMSSFWFLKLYQRSKHPISAQSDGSMDLFWSQIFYLSLFFSRFLNVPGLSLKSLIAMLNSSHTSLNTHNHRFFKLWRDFERLEES